MKIRLASGSPRRAELLEAAGIVFVVTVPHVEENKSPHESPEAYVRRLSLEKAQAVYSQSDDLPVLAADTVVVLDSTVLEKPSTEAEALSMLHSLSGRAHDVMTAFTLLSADKEHTQVVSTRVDFRSLADTEIKAYVASGEPFDKAGGYGIQAGAAHMVRRLEGSYTNVVGLPMAEVLEALRGL